MIRPEEQNTARVIFCSLSSINFKPCLLLLSFIYFGNLQCLVRSGASVILIEMLWSQRIRVRQTSSHQHEGKKSKDSPPLQLSFFYTTNLLIQSSHHHVDRFPHSPRRTTPGHPHRKLQRHNLRCIRQSHRPHSQNRSMEADPAQCLFRHRNLERYRTRTPPVVKRSRKPSQQRMVPPLPRRTKRNFQSNTRWIKSMDLGPSSSLQPQHARDLQYQKSAL